MMMMMDGRRRLVAVGAALRTAVGVGCVASALGVGTLYLAQRRLIFPRPEVVELPSTYGGSKASLLRLAAPEGPPEVGGEVVCVVFEPPSATAPVLVYFHGNADQIGWSGAWLGKALGDRAGLIAVEYPGYALAPGEPTQASIMWAARRAVRHARDRFGDRRVVLVGQSLGSAPAVSLADQASKIVLISPFTSILDVAHAVLPIFPKWILASLVKDKFDNLKILVRKPALVVHGERDEIVPIAQGRRLAAAIPGARFVSLPHAGHNDLFSSPHAARLFDEILHFSTTIRS